MLKFLLFFLTAYTVVSIAICDLSSLMFILVISCTSSCYVTVLVSFVCVPLTLLFRKVVEGTEVPEDWKQANVTPIFKSGME